MMLLSGIPTTRRRGAWAVREQAVRLWRRRFRMLQWLAGRGWAAWPGARLRWTRSRPRRRGRQESVPRLWWPEAPGIRFV